MDQLDHTRAAREEALNSLEAYIYGSRDFLDDDIFQKVSSDEERNLFKEKLSAASEWLFASDSSTLEDFESKLAELTYLHAPNRLILVTSRDLFQKERQIILPDHNKSRFSKEFSTPHKNS